MLRHARVTMKKNMEGYILDIRTEKRGRLVLTEPAIQVELSVVVISTTSAYQRVDLHWWKILSGVSRFL